MNRAPRWSRDARVDARTTGRQDSNDAISGGLSRSGRSSAARRHYTGIRSRWRRGTVSVVAPVEGTLPGIVTKEPNADGGKRLEDVAFDGGLEARIGRPTVGLDAPVTEQRVKGNGHDGWAIATADPVIAALPENCRERPFVVEQAIPQLDAGRVDIRYRAQRRNHLRAIPWGWRQVGVAKHPSKPG